MSIATLHITLFGKFTIRRGSTIAPTLTAHKLQKLFGYLLLHRDRQHPREVLADRFWNDRSTAQARAHLRKALWELQEAISDGAIDPNTHVLLVDADWVQLNPQADLWIDVAEFEQAFKSVKDVPGEQIDAIRAQRLEAAIGLYRGDLLEGWYHDWCLYERERLQQIYLSMLDKLMGYCEMQHHYEQGIAYGMQILRYDRAHEQTYRRLMRLHFLAGDRTAALRHYERCVAALQDELGVAPTDDTMALHTQIKANRLNDYSPPQSRSLSPVAVCDQLAEVLVHLHQIQTKLHTFEQQVSHDIQLVARVLEMSR